MVLGTVSGCCLCGSVGYKISGDLGIFQYCHCSRCRKVTGSAHASNLLVLPEQFSWIEGENYVERFEPRYSKHFATCFCKLCGSLMPWLSKSGKAMVIPAGTLNDDPNSRPSQNIFWGSRANWYIEASELPKYNQLPIKN